MSMDNSMYDGVEFVAHDLETMHKQYDRLRYDHQLLHKHLALLRQEVKAWRDWFDRDGKRRSGIAKLKDVRAATDESGALIERAKP